MCVCESVFWCRCARLREAPRAKRYTLSSGVMDGVDAISHRRCFTGREWSSLWGRRVMGSLPANMWTDGPPTAKATSAGTSSVAKKKNTQTHVGVRLVHWRLTSRVLLENCQCLHNTLTPSACSPQQKRSLWKFFEMRSNWNCGLQRWKCSRNSTHCIRKDNPWKERKCTLTWKFFCWCTWLIIVEVKYSNALQIQTVN